MRVKFKSIKYSVDKQNKVVVCIGKWDIQDIYDYVTPNFGWIAYDYLRNYFKCAKIDSIIFKGIARCSPEDEFDEVIGKRLAESRMQIKAFNTVGNSLRHMLGTMQKWYEGVSNNLLVLNYRQAKELNHLNKLLVDGNKLLSKK